jgi:hypothetical protein
MAASQPRSARLAVLIDADNASPRIAAGLFEEIARIGEASVRRIYGDFSSPRLKSWADILARHAIVPHQQFAYIPGKNASDIALVIDAMDLLHTGRFEGFCLVSSDSDFTRLASRIREQGVDVFGFGEQKTAESFRQACRRFIYTENLLPQAFVANEAGATGAGTPGQAVAVAKRRGAVAAPGDRADGRRRGLGQSRARRPATRQPGARFRPAYLRPRQAERPRAQERRLRGGAAVGRAGAHPPQARPEAGRRQEEGVSAAQGRSDGQ